MPLVPRDLTPSLVNTSKIILSQQLFSHVISLASCPGKCQALNVFVFALVVLRSYWNTSGDLFCIKLLAYSDIEKKQVETERGLWTSSHLILIADSLSALAAWKLPWAFLWLVCFVSLSIAGQSCACVFSPFCSPERLVKTPYLLMNERNFSCVGGTWLMQLWPAPVGHWVKGAPKGEAHWKHPSCCGARKCHQQAFSSRQGGGGGGDKKKRWG